MPYLRGTVSQSSRACFCCAGAGEGEGVIFESICKKPRMFETRDCEKPVPYLKGTVCQSPGTTSVIQQRVRALLDGVIVVGFAFHNDLSVLGVTPGANESESFQRAQEWIAEVVRGALGRQQFLQAQLHAYNCVFQLMTDEQVSKVAF